VPLARLTTQRSWFANPSTIGSIRAAASESARIVSAVHAASFALRKSDLASVSNVSSTCCSLWLGTRSLIWRTK
jgi:hypothetical protein